MISEIPKKAPLGNDQASIRGFRAPRERESQIVKVSRKIFNRSDGKTRSVPTNMQPSLNQTRETRATDRMISTETRDFRIIINDHKI
ncbi:hypothetical protein [Candidatus Bathycorpusculum sp.]|uniref:hypothetical protein n=1 Tax=Candidatus Bathycorpusculum sp. TaxID=2994959 RepID=UPI00283838AE|nr:hypothetical protein [Candidatus Termitimicrobium sp.]MCL2685479.1 hypothetical protein [Candidatus Termitimicrobium sp.]